MDAVVKMQVKMLKSLKHCCFPVSVKTMLMKST